jgi:hypothetical protein
LDLELVEEGDKVRHADARAPVGVDVYFNGEQGSGHDANPKDKYTGRAKNGIKIFDRITG